MAAGAPVSSQTVLKTMFIYLATFFVAFGLVEVDFDWPGSGALSSTRVEPEGAKRFSCRSVHSLTPSCESATVDKDD